jgi:hypothetical protein
MWPIIGTEAVAAGEITRGALRWNFTPVHPDVYMPKDARRNLYTNAAAAWLWTARQGIVAGRAAAALHGVRWIEDTAPIELIAKHGRRRPGVILRNERVGNDEVSEIAGLLVTSPARTVLDLARRLPRDAAVAHIDAVARATGVTIADVRALEDRYQGAQGIRAARIAVDLMDGGAQSPRETSVRLMLIDAGLPRPRTGIPLSDESWETTVAMGWDGPMIGIDCEDDPPPDGFRAVQAIACEELFQRLGWFHIRVHPKHTRHSVVHRARLALRQRR